MEGGCESSWIERGDGFIQCRIVGILTSPFAGPIVGHWGEVDEGDMSSYCRERRDCELEGVR